MAGTPPFRKLQYVVAVVRELHFGKAAERLHVDPSTLSRQIREVEEELGFDIFLRKNHYVAVLEEAKPFVLALEQAMANFVAEYEKGRDLSRLLSRRRASSFLIGYSAFVESKIPDEIRTVHSQRFSTIHLALRRATAEEMIDSLNGDVFQACVMLGTPGNRNFDEFPLRCEPVFAVWPRTHQAIHGCAVPLTDLRGYPLVIPCSEHTDAVMHQWLFDQFTTAGFRPRIAAEASDASEAFNLVQDGLGVAILPRGACQDAPRDLRCSPIDGIESLQLILACRRMTPYRVRKIVSEIASSLGRADLKRVG
jgi:DNA-binding transcriptional LysR family regulator